MPYSTRVLGVATVTVLLHDTLLAVCLELDSLADSETAAGYEPLETDAASSEELNSASDTPQEGRTREDGSEPLEPSAAAWRPFAGIFVSDFYAN